MKGILDIICPVEKDIRDKAQGKSFYPCSSVAIKRERNVMGGHPHRALNYENIYN